MNDTGQANAAPAPDAAIYDMLWRRRADDAAIPDRIAETARRLRPGGVLVDVGAGDGRLAELAQPHFQRIVCLDFSEGGLAACRAKGFVARAADLNGRLPLADNDADAVTCVDVIEHILDPRRLLTEMARILKPGGELIVTTPNLRFIAHVAGLLFAGRAPHTSLETEGYDGGHLHYFTFAELAGLFRAAGLEVTEQTGIARRLYDSWKIRLFRRLSRVWEPNADREFFHLGILMRGRKGAAAGSPA